MTETILKSLMRLFAIATNINPDIQDKARSIVKSYLYHQVRKEIVEQFLVLFDYYNKKFKNQATKKTQKQLSLDSVKAVLICEEINKELPQKQRVHILLQMLEVISNSPNFSIVELDFIKTISDSFKIPRSEFENCRSFIFKRLDEIPDRNTILIVNNKKYLDDSEIKHIYRKNFDGTLLFLQLAFTSTYIFTYSGKDELYLNGREIKQDKLYFLTKGASIQSIKVNIHSLKMEPLYYNDIVNRFLVVDTTKEITLTAKNIEYRYPKSNSGIRHLNFTASSGQIIGVMGVSGVGKTTLINILNGNIIPHSGQILINGYDIEIDKEKLVGLVGFIPQDDLLMEELSVYRNLYFNAKLCFSDSSEEEIESIVNKTLTDLDLYDVKDQLVGNPLKNYISGGQRKRLNIAMELIREPAILLVDEPTSGLSSKDSENVMELLKEQTLKGRLVIVNIHQPSSNTYKLFDKILVLDLGGIPIYYGNPIDLIVYFKTLSHKVNPSESECTRCGNIDSEQILEIIEAKSIDGYGEFTNERKTSPEKWHEEYVENIEMGIDIDDRIKDIPESSFKVPNVFKQFKIFSLRNILSKISDIQYMLISFLEAPILAVILGYFTKYNSGNSLDPNAYVFSANENLPSYLFMSVVVALFLGLTMSSEEIIRDRRTLKRESFLHLSKRWYIHSKILYLFVVSAFQMFTYVILGNLILGIKGLNFEYWLVLFSASCFSNMLGLNISSGFKSVVTIYITIPFILIPQLLFSGVIVKFDKLHSSVTSYKYVPFVGDIMASRWAYEALAVNQFRNNKYQQMFFDIEKKESNATYMSNYLIPELITVLNNCKRRILVEHEPERAEKDLKLLKSELKKIYSKSTFAYFSINDTLNTGNFNNEVYNSIYTDMKLIKTYYNSLVQDAFAEKDKIINDWANNKNNMPLYKIKDDYYNHRLAELTLNKKEIEKVLKKDDSYIRQFEPIYQIPESDYGRSHFYASEKSLFGFKINTLKFNIVVLWIMSLVLYFTLLNDVMRKMITFSKRNKSLVKKINIQNK